MWKLICAALLLIAPAALAQESVRITAVNYPLQYLTQRLVGDAGVVDFPVPAGTDPSFWRPSVADISAIQSSDLIVLNGAGFATWTDRVSLPRARVLNTSRLMKHRYIETETITHSHGDGGTHSHEGIATYTWLDPTFARAQAEAIAAKLTAKGLVPEDVVAARLAALRDELNALDALAAGALAPAAGVPLIATHPRYQYLADRYDLQITALEWEAGTAPDAEELAALEDLVATSGARVLIWEAAPPQAAIDQAAALGLTSVVFEPMAHAPQDGTFLSAFASAIERLASATRQSLDN
ncbi:MAG: metal ABC transporter substrate-binding protein [Pseudomonadota bacterium]